MANNSDMGRSEAQAQLELMESDRRQLANRLATPWALMAGAGAALAWFVADAATANPGSQYRASSGYLLAAAVLCMVVYALKRETGVKFRGLGTEGWLIAVGMMVWTLMMFSGALAIVSTGHRPWATVPVLLTWIVGTFGSAAMFRSCVKATRHD